MYTTLLTKPNKPKNKTRSITQSFHNNSKQHNQISSIQAKSKTHPNKTAKQTKQQSKQTTKNQIKKQSTKPKS